MMNEYVETIKFFENWIDKDRKELNGDTESDYAKKILNDHKHIRFAIEKLKDIVDPTRGYAE